ncbi:hypothetical protein [Afipia sp. Root123D2]|uniref:hypothetical protein n=1 Tax=Afipia sp. Root123D2 TaxID=1736436 RepID=UPI0012E84A1C|nr:hypothetical protein [Afipia sp. Root123D2]
MIARVDIDEDQPDGQRLRGHIAELAGPCVLADREQPPSLRPPDAFRLRICAHDAHRDIGRGIEIDF